MNFQSPSPALTHRIPPLTKTFSARSLPPCPAHAPSYASPLFGVPQPAPPRRLRAASPLLGACVPLRTSRLRERRRPALARAAARNRASSPRHSAPPYPSAPQGLRVQLRASAQLNSSASHRPSQPRGWLLSGPAEAEGSPPAGERQLTCPPLRGANPSSSRRARCYFSRYLSSLYCKKLLSAGFSARDTPGRWEVCTRGGLACQNKEKMLQCSIVPGSMRSARLGGEEVPS